MGRRPRLEHPGGLYHLYQRGHNRAYVFGEDEDKTHFLELLHFYRQSLGFDLLAYVIMGNHYHLLVKLGKSSMPVIMQRLISRYSRAYNRCHQRSGSLFEGRYRAIPVMDDAYFLSLVRYIHQTPLEARICRKVQDYPWSSDKHYRKLDLGGPVQIRTLLGLLSPDLQKAHRAYLHFMEGRNKDFRLIEEADLSAREEGDLLTAYLKPSRRPLESLLGAQVPDQVTYYAIRSGSRERLLTPIKRAFIEAAYREGYSLKEIGEFLGVTDAAVSQLRRKE